MAWVEAQREEEQKGRESHAGGSMPLRTPKPAPQLLPSLAVGNLLQDQYSYPIQHRRYWEGHKGT